LAEAQTLEKYRHEWLAEFGDPTAGVFKSAFVDWAMKPYSLKTLIYDPNKRHVMGIDWNGKGTGTGCGHPIRPHHPQTARGSPRGDRRRQGNDQEVLQ